ncbi:hypothetical protein SPAN111604_14315 [Sphingomonas antarctica]|uniref:hypothetical protein n=1 Tax=Sphingomonas antarctica TaxID=2040274 RepID=UPI0039EBE3E9
MTSSYLSRPLLTMLGAADVDVRDVQKEIAQQMGGNRYPVLRSDHLFVRRVREATGVHLTVIAWRYNRLLMSIEQIKDGRIHWMYHEFKSSQCSFRCRTQQSAVVTGALRRKHFAVVTDKIGVLADVRIAGLDEHSASEGWLSLKLAPEWISF